MRTQILILGVILYLIYTSYAEVKNRDPKLTEEDFEKLHEYLNNPNGENQHDPKILEYVQKLKEKSMFFKSKANPSSENKEQDENAKYKSEKKYGSKPKKMI